MRQVLRLASNRSCKRTRTKAAKSAVFNDLNPLKVYFISRGVLKTANKQYSKLNNDYELTFSNDTVIEPCPDEDNSLPHMNLDLVKLNDLPHKNANDFVG